MSERIAPAQPPYPPQVQEVFDRFPPSWQPPFKQLTILARDARLFERLTRGHLLDRGQLTIRQREIVIDRVTARCDNEYEWGMHVNLYAAKAELDDAQVHATVHGDAAAPCWGPEDRLLIRLCDELHATCDVSDGLWRELRAAFSEEAILELLMLAGYYRMVSYLSNALRLPLERVGRPFPPA